MRRLPNKQKPIEHEDEDEGYQSPEEFLDHHHPENDQYMRAIKHVQAQIMYLTRSLRPKQVNMIKSVFAGDNFAETGKKHGAVPSTVSRLVKSRHGNQLLTMLQYLQTLTDGPNEAMRRNMLWRIAQKEEKFNSNTSIKAISEINKMHFQTDQLKNNLSQPQQQQPAIVVNIDQRILPRGALD